MKSRQRTASDFASISPSAKALVLLKGLTDIPFARRVAELASQPEKYVPDFDSKDFMKWIRVLHFEARYRSIDQLLRGLQIGNILELSSGYSLRGLARVLDEKIHYIDTDLEEMAAVKLRLTGMLQEEGALKPAGKLEVLPLNAVDEDQFRSIAGRFDEGPLAIVNEGLLMYLDDAEKKAVCRNIKAALQQHGGYWITADVYIKSGQDYPGDLQPDELQKFFDRHKIREKMFDSFEVAEAFLREQGFIIDKEAEAEYANCSTLKYVMQLLTDEQKVQMANSPKIHATWRLKLA